MAAIEEGLTYKKASEICDPILENQPYRGIIDFEIWLCKVIAGVVGQK